MKESRVLRLRAAALFARAWPAHCIVCGESGFSGSVDLCPGCRDDLPRIGAACPKCAAPGPDGMLCGRCLAAPPAYDRAVCPFAFEFPVASLVRALKFHGRLAAGRVLGVALAARIATEAAPRPGAIIPVPLGPRRLKQRGFNQATEIARPVATALGIALATRHAIRVRETTEQTGLAARARARNVRDAFRMLRPLPVAHVAIVDDVMTTGSTVNALAAILKRSGAKRVDVWTVARAD